MAKRMLIGSVLVLLVLAIALTGYTNIDSEALKHNTSNCAGNNNCGQCPQMPNCPTPSGGKSGSCTEMKSNKSKMECSSNDSGCCGSAIKTSKSSNCCSQK